MKTAENKKINFFTVALMYVGTIMGAGFASGRESWQFFGVFGKNAYLGIAIAGAMFMALGMMVSYIALQKNTNDMGKIIMPVDTPKATEAVGYFMAAILYTIIISMSAAGGSFLNQQFGIHKAIGGAIIVALVIFTVLGDFERISKVFKLIIPILFAVVVICSILVIFSDIKQSGKTSGFPPSDMAKTWYVSAVIFISYNMLGMISVVASSSIRAKDEKNAIAGSALGGIMLAIMTLVLVIALQKDMAFTQSLDLPMLGFSARISTIANIMYGAVLFAAIYSAATSTYYGFSTKLKEGKWKRYIVVIGAILGFLGGMCGFKAIVAYLYPIEGYIGIVIIILITINFFKTTKNKDKNTEKNIDKNIEKDENIDIDKGQEDGHK